MSKKVFTLLLMAAVAFFAAASAGNAADPAQSPEGKFLSIKDIENWQGTDMFHCEGWNDFQIVIADTVLTRDPETGKLLPGIASGYSYSEDGLTLRLTFPEGMKFPNGDQLEPEDFIASIEYGRDGVYAEGYENIKSMETDGRDVVCHLSEYRSDLDYFLGGCFIGIISKKQIDSMSRDELLWGAVPYGPFYVDEHVQGSHVVLRPNPGYKTNNPLVENKAVPHIAGMRVNLTEMEDFTIATALKEGDFDFVAQPTVEAVNEIRGAPGITLDDATFPTIEFVVLNNDNKHLSDPKVREAIFLLADRDSFADMAGSDFIPQHSLVVNTMMNYSKEAEDYFKANYGYNPEKAKTLLAEAGYSDSNGDGYLDKNGEALELTFIVRTTGMSVILGQDWQIQLKEAGIKLNLETLDWEYRNERIRADDYDMALASLGWGEPVLLLNNFRRDPNAVPNAEEYSAKVKALAGVMDYDKRTQLVGDMLKTIYGDLNCLPLYTERVYCAYGPKAEGVKVYPDATMFFNDIK
ncbi:MAG: ABC transporter substrate-binding protein [Synergistaceae bacterium]|jgi:ABC-type transport system substrate-binding protein|nr:ABC transporter substrate-binding protein [Synergistaceae bacterium]